MSTAGHKTVKLLLVDDNPLVRELTVKGLEPFCEVETSTDGADALRFHPQTIFDQRSSTHHEKGGRSLAP